MAGFDAVFVGSGINSLAGAALLAQRGWRVCVLEREERLGGCLYTSDDLTLPGFTHEVLASWHPLWTGGGAYAELKDELDRRGLEYVNTDLPTGTAFPDGSAAFISTSLEENVAELDRHAAGDGAAWEAVLQRLHGERRPRVRPARHRALVDRRPRPGTHGRAPPRPARPARVRRRHARLLPRLGHRDVSLRGCARAPGALGAAHGARARPGDLRLHDAGDRRGAPARRHAGAGRRRACAGRRRSPRSSATRAGTCGRRPTSSGSSSRAAQATGVRLTGGEVVAAERAVVAGVTPTQLYGRLLGPGEVPDDGHQGGGALPLRPLRDADPPGPRRPTGLEGRSGGGARTLSRSST